MGSDIEEGKAAPLSTSENKSGKFRHCLCGERALNSITIVSALACVGCLGMAFFIAGAPQDAATLLQQSLRVLNLVLCLLIVLTETEWERFAVAFPVLENWLGRGFLQVFEALLTLELTSVAATLGDTDLHKSLQLYRSVSGFSLLGCGALYVCTGVLCCHTARRKTVRYKRDVERQRLLSDLEAIDQKRAELNSMLAVYSNK